MDNIWFGTEASYYSGLESLKKYEAHKATHVKAERDDGEEERSTYLSVVDNVGIITVQGSLYDGKFGWIGAMFGITGYGDIQEALIQAVEDQDVKSILLVVKSGGGSVSGVNETAQLISNVDKVKAVTCYSPSMMASAALWLGLSARETFVSDTCISGSIGTLLVMVSRAEQLKKDGIDARVVRSGKYKALGHPVEPISEEALAKAQEQADYLSNIFLTYVAEKRGVNKSAADARFGQGREFVGAQAVDVGLVDGVRTYSSAFQYAKSTAPADNKQRFVGSAVVDAQITADNASQPQGTSMPNPHIPTPEQLAAMAGVTLEVTAEQKAADEAAALKLKADADAAAAAAAKTGGDESTVIAELSASVTDLTGKLEAAIAETAELQASLAAAKTDAEAATAKIAGLEGLAGIATASIKTMSVALNLSNDNLAGLAPEALAAKHAEVSSLFKSKFKVGGVAATSASAEDETPKNTSVNPLFLAAAQLNKGR